MLLVDAVAGELRIVDRLKHKVQLLQGFQSGALAASSVERSLAVLGRYGELLEPLSRSNIAVKGAYALRVADNRATFTKAAEAILGAPVDVISGEEEARLIDVGVSRHLDRGGQNGNEDGRCLVIDIGGGSTEFALSERSKSGRRLVSSLSLPLGCVSLSDVWLSRPELVEAAWRIARQEALSICDDKPKLFHGAEVNVGTSGILESILTVCEANGFSQGAITRLGLHAVESALTSGRWVADLGLPGLAPERTDIFPAGVAILSAVMEKLAIQHVHFSDATLPFGILYDMLSWASDPDPRSHAVDSLMSRFQVDRDQSTRVEARALGLLKSARPSIDRRHQRLLIHAARLHEIGLAIGPQGFHRRGAYLLQHTHLRGFEPHDQQALAWLIRNHRRGLPAGIDATGAKLGFSELSTVLFALRLAVILERARSDTTTVTTKLRLSSRSMELAIDPGWLGGHALMRSGLEEERVLINRLGYSFEF